jgi:hypothetical protein
VTKSSGVSPPFSHRRIVSPAPDAGAAVVGAAAAAVVGGSTALVLPLCFASDPQAAAIIVSAATEAATPVNLIETPLLL